ncbi:MAG: tetratricopeptide repeat protein, partial [Methylococcales bacterium]
MQWALYYPPIIDYRPGTAGGPERQRAVSLYRTGQISAAIQVLNTIPDGARDTSFFTQRAAILLSVGEVESARNDIEQALALTPNSGTPVALRSIIELTRNNKEEALSLAEKAVKLEPDSPTSRVALSYARQAAFDIEGAQESIEKAVELSPDDPLAWARLAELELSTGELDEALEAAQKAEALDPALSHTQMVLGFARLLQIDIEEAKESFNKAIELDPSAPLPRLGMGLAKIRQGDVEGGTKDIEVAAVLDPENSLIRSYLGKAYYEEKRGDIASREFEIAKKLDPNDPTPWLYDAIHKQTTNRPVEALHDMQKAIELNDNRAVYRSSLHLDDDLAARSASLGRIYTNLGFEQIGLLEGWKSQNVDPSNYSVHRLLSDNYAGLPRHQIARVSELLQSQILQPINITPVQPQLADSNLLIFSGLGPASPSFNEFNPLFARNRFALQASGIIGSNDTYGDEVVQSGLYNRFSYSLGQYHYQTGGFRPNSDFGNNIYNAFLQTVASTRLNLQFEYRKENSDAGDLRQLLDADFLIATRRQKLDRDSARFGFNFEISPDANLLGSFSYGKLSRNLSDPGFVPIRTRLEGFDPPIPDELLDAIVSVLPRGFNSQDDISNDAENWSGELQLLGRWSRVNLIMGVSHVNQSVFRQRIQSTALSSQLDQNFVSNLASSIPNSILVQFPGSLPMDIADALVVNFINPTIDQETQGGVQDIDDVSSNENHTVGYIYFMSEVLDHLTFTLGGSVHSIDRTTNLGNSLDINSIYVNPKVGVIWQPFKNTILRAASFQSSKRPFAANQTLEPTNVAGFNQFFDDPENSRSTRYGFGINQALSSNLTVGGELSWRKLIIPSIVPVPETLVPNLSQDEESHRAYA